MYIAIISGIIIVMAVVFLLGFRVGANQADYVTYRDDIEHHNKVVRQCADALRNNAEDFVEDIAPYYPDTLELIERLAVEVEEQCLRYR